MVRFLKKKKKIKNSSRRRGGKRNAFRDDLSRRNSSIAIDKILARFAYAPPCSTIAPRVVTYSLRGLYTSIQKRPTLFSFRRVCPHIFARFYSAILTQFSIWKRTSDIIRKFEMNFFFFFSPLSLRSQYRNDTKEHIYIYIRTLFVLFSSEEGKGVSFILSRCNTMQEKVYPPSRERFLKRFINFRINCAFESEAFQNFVVQAAHCRFLCRQTMFQEAALQVAIVNRQFSPFPSYL